MVIWRRGQWPAFLRVSVPLTPAAAQPPPHAAEEHITLGAELADGSLIVGQHQISHPSSTGAHAAQPA